MNKSKLSQKIEGFLISIGGMGQESIIDIFKDIIMGGIKQGVIAVILLIALYCYKPFLAFILLLLIICIVLLMTYKLISEIWRPEKDIWKLSQKRRLRLLSRWKQLKANPQVLGDRTAIPKTEQIKRQKKLPINFKPINNLLTFLDLEEYQLKIPLSYKKYIEIRGKCDKVVGIVSDKISELLGTNKSPKLISLLNDIYKDLSGEITYKPKAYTVGIVPGARTTLRANKAGQLYSNGIIHKIYLTGNFPTYIQKDEREYEFISEAEAMAIYLHEECRLNIPLKDLIIDKKARNTIQNVRYSIETLKKLSFREQSKINILLITSPYHLKRSLLHFQWLKLHDLKYVIGDIGLCPTETKYSKDEWYRKYNGVKTYIQEYWKIHGARITGEF